MENLIELKDLTFWYGDNQDLPVLQDINLDIGPGESVAIIGANGSGKSTLIRLINGLLMPKRGKAFVGGLITSEERDLLTIRQIVGMVFQNPDTQLFAPVVEEDVAFGLENLCLPPEEIRERVKTALDQVGMAEYRLHPPHGLSGGQKQRVALAGILAMQPQCIILDEPTSMLDPKGKKDIIRAVSALNAERGITVVYVTHDMAEVFHCCRLVALAHGRIVFDGEPQDFFADPLLPGQVGVTCPPVRELINLLRDDGVELPGSIESVEDLVDYICR